MKTKNLVIIFIFFLLIALGSGLVVFLTREKEQPVLNRASEKTNVNNQPLATEPSGQTVKNEPVAEEKKIEINKDKPVLNKTVETKPIVQTENTTASSSLASPASSGLRQGGPASANQVAQIQAVLLINGVEYKTNVKTDSSAYDLMNELKNQNKIDFQGKNYSDLGFFVEQINGLKNNPLGKNWVYYINGQPAQVGISNYKIKASDVIEWKYEKKSF